MKKRIMSMLLMLTMVFSLIVVPNTATAVTYHDTVDTDCELAVDVLDALGIMRGYTDGSFLPYNTITKAEMASVAVKLAGVNEYSEEAPDDMELFNDMYDYEGWAAGVVAMAKTMGIARSDENGNFNPDMSATYEDAVQMVVSALGYGHQAQSRGDTLLDYVYVGQKLGITKKLDTGIGENITRADVAKLVYAALTVDIMAPVSYSVDGTMYLTHLKVLNWKHQFLLTHLIHLHRLRYQIRTFGLDQLHHISQPYACPLFVQWQCSVPFLKCHCHKAVPRSPWRGQ